MIGLESHIDAAASEAVIAPCGLYSFASIEKSDEHLQSTE